MENKIIQTAEIKYVSPRPVNIGDVFYRIERGDCEILRSPCRVCLGTGEVTVNGITFKCPKCNEEQTVLRVSQWVVRKYRVNHISDTVSDTEWKASNLHRIIFKAYRKVGHGISYSNNHSTCTITEDNLKKYFNVPLDEVKEPYTDKYLYDDYKLAVLAADYLTAQELQKVADYNAQHGTSHEVHFKADHDKKSI